MPYFKTSQEWLDHSVALLEARPSSTRVTARYSIKPVKPRKSTPTTTSTTTDQDSTNAPDTATTTTSTSTPATTTPTSAANANATKPPRGSLVLKTYDPVSGVTLKYRTTKAAEVTRLMGAAMGRLGRAMAGVQDVAEEEMRDVDGAEGDSGAQQQQQQQQQKEGQGQKEGQQQGGGGGKKKKKGKK
ncbi:signal recognition particle 9 kDa domain-containing protein [Trichoderma novae-zelandiae]